MESAGEAGAAGRGGTGRRDGSMQSRSAPLSSGRAPRNLPDALARTWHYLVRLQIAMGLGLLNRIPHPRFLNATELLRPIPAPRTLPHLSPSSAALRDCAAPLLTSTRHNLNNITSTSTAEPGSDGILGCCMAADPRLRLERVRTWPPASALLPSHSRPPRTAPARAPLSRVCSSVHLHPGDTYHHKVTAGRRGQGRALGLALGHLPAAAGLRVGALGGAAGSAALVDVPVVLHHWHHERHRDGCRTFTLGQEFLLVCSAVLCSDLRPACSVRVVQQDGRRAGADVDRRMRRSSRATSR